MNKQIENILKEIIELNKLAKIEMEALCNPSFERSCDQCVDLSFSENNATEAK